MTPVPPRALRWLAGIGLYGVMAFNVARRTREIGIRMALGSTRGMVLRQVLAEALSLVGAGTLLGCAAAALIAQALSSASRCGQPN